MIKIKQGYELKKVLDDYMVIPAGEAMTEFSGTLLLSETAARAWELLKEGCDREELVEGVLAEYSADRAVVEADVEELLQRLGQYGVLEM